MAPFARYLVASELLEPGDGWDYTALGNITAAGGGGAGLAPADVGALLVRSYMETSTRQGLSGLSLALTDLGAAAALQRDVLALARGLTAQLRGINRNGARCKVARAGRRRCGAAGPLAWHPSRQHARVMLHARGGGLVAAPPRPPLNPSPIARRRPPQPPASRCCSSERGSARSRAPRRTSTWAPCWRASGPAFPAPRTRACCRWSRRRRRATRRPCGWRCATTSCETCGGAGAGLGGAGRGWAGLGGEGLGVFGGSWHAWCAAGLQAVSELRQGQPASRLPHARRPLTRLPTAPPASTTPPPPGHRHGDLLPADPGRLRPLVRRRRRCAAPRAGRLGGVPVGALRRGGVARSRAQRA
jgi:hypothetical protein